MKFPFRIKERIKQRLRERLQAELKDRAPDVLMSASDGVMSWLPFPRPSEEKLRSAKVVAHRGDCTKGAIENTLPAFRAAKEGGVWGLEFDIHWTRDEVPVICHDPTPERVFGEAQPICDYDAITLRQRLPLIPTLSEILAEFGGKCHLMIELKDPLNARHAAVLKNLLVTFEPTRDYHIISLQAEALMSCVTFDLVPRAALLTISEFNAGAMSDASLAHGFGGYTGQYMLITNDTIRRHHAKGQGIGSGFIDSRRLLYREINRGVDWLFTNRACEIMSYLET